MSRTNVFPETAHSMARGLGWFSIGLGLAEILAPRALTRGLGMEGHEQIVRAYGVREIATGIGILSSTHPVPWIWGRVGAMRSISPRSRLDCSRTIRKKTMSNLLWSPLRASRRWMSSAELHSRVAHLHVIRVSNFVAAVRRSTIIAGPASPSPLSRCGERRETSRFPETCAPPRRYGLS